MKITLYALKRIFDVRWASTQESALKAIIQMYSCIWKTLSTLADSQDRDQLEEKSAAHHKISTITDANFNAAIAYFQDIFFILKQYSNVYQRTAGVLPGQKSSYLELKERLNQLKVTPGPYLAAAAARISCVIQAACTRGQACQPYFFDSAARVQDNVPLFLDDPIESVDEQSFVFAGHNSRTSWPSLKSYRNKYIDGLDKS